MDAYEFLEIVGAKEKSLVVDIKFGYIDENYTTGKPKVLFDGEDAVSTKAYPYLSSYTPVANDRIMCLQKGSVIVVVSKVII